MAENNTLPVVCTAATAGTARNPWEPLVCQGLKQSIAPTVQHMAGFIFCRGIEGRMASLCDLGLSSYENRAYRALLNLGPSTAQEISDESGVPMGRIYDAMNGLVAHEVVRSQTDSRPRKYIAVEPSIAIDRLLDSRRQELHEQLDRYETIAEEVLDELAVDAPSEERFWTAAVGAEGALELLFERLESAQERIVVVADEISAQFDLDEVGSALLDELEAALKRGVDVSILLTESIIQRVPDGLMSVVDREPFQSDRFSVRIAPELYGRFNIIDRSEVCIEIANPTARNTMLGMVDLQDPEFTAEVERTYKRLWDGAEPL